MPLSRPRTILGLAVLAAAGCHARTAAYAGEDQAVGLQVVMVSARGEGGQPDFDPRIPAKLRHKLARLHLSYSEYLFLGAPRQQTPMGQLATFPLPAKEALTIKPLAARPASRLIRLDTCILDARRRPILTSQVRVGYGRIFLLHRPKGPTGLLLGISAHRAER
jgi:hypothetical protein